MKEKYQKIEVLDSNGVRHFGVHEVLGRSSQTPAEIKAAAAAKAEEEEGKG